MAESMRYKLESRIRVNPGERETALTLIRCAKTVEECMRLAPDAPQPAKDWRFVFTLSQNSEEVTIHGELIRND